MRNFKNLTFVLLLPLTLLWTGIVAAEEPILPESEGLWEYTSLITSSGESLPQTGVFLIKNGSFLQQSVYVSEDITKSDSMAHAGSCWAGGVGLRLQADQTLSMSPVGDNALTSMGVTQHDLKVTRENDKLTLVFGAGTSTIQTFRRLGDASDMQLYNFENGALAFADGYFILVTGDDESAVTGYGKYQRSANDLTLNVIRWAQSDGKTTENQQDVTLQASFDDKVLSLPDGKSFSVIQ